MLNCFINQFDSGKVIPITPIATSLLDDWVAKQDVRIQNWIGSVGFKAKPGAIALICDVEGHLEKVLLGIQDFHDLKAFGQLPTTLPQGCYCVDSDELSAQELDQAVLAWGMGSYQFATYKKVPLLETRLLLPAEKMDVNYLQALLTSIYLVRDLINTPADDMMPPDLAEIAVQLADKFDGQVTQIIGDELLTHNYPAIYAVGRASEHAPRLIDLRWGNEKNPKLTLVGKGVCFDSGGLDLKNSANMAQMKKDMAGGAHVLGLAQMIMALQLPVRLRVLIPAVENAISGDAYHPGDIIVTRKGISVEVTNTDAEGRVILSDALCEAASEQPELLLDFSTLTGAARVALGTEMGALFTPDDELAAALVQCGQAEHDPIWRLPLYAPYKKLLDSKIADIVNAPSAAYGGAIIAALFLQEFVPSGVTWAHFDIMAWNISSKAGSPEGGEAHALRAVARYLWERYS